MHTMLIRYGWLVLLGAIGGKLGAQPIDIRVHDPVLIRQDSFYYLFHTGRGISQWRSKDLRQWERLEPVFAEAPAWTEQVVPGFRQRNHIWAPDVLFYRGRYYLFYSISAFAKNTSAIGVATNLTLNPADPAYRWEDHGPVVRSVPGRDMWNAIDPNVVFDEKGQPWLVFGSFWLGIKLVRLDTSLTRLAEPQEWYTVAARPRTMTLDERDPGDGAIEAPFLFRKGDFFYLFVSWDYCCRGVRSNYKIVVGRARDIRGPYLDREGRDMRQGGGTLVLEGNERWPGVGHCAVYTFEGRDFLVFHGYDRLDEGRPKLWILPLLWDSEGWPLASLDD